MKFKVLNVIFSIFIVWLIGCTPMINKRIDPLIGKIYDSSNQKEISYEELFKKIQANQVIYLGENHENSDHHAIQLQILQDLIRAGKKPLIGFEFFSTAQTSHLMTFVQAKSYGDSNEEANIRENDLREKLGWQNQNDQFWKFYFQLIELALKNRLTIFGTDLPKGVIKRIVRVGIGQLTPVEKKFIQSTNFNDPIYKKLMFSKFKAVHCGFSTPKMSERMYQDWVARNDSMASSIAAMLLDDVNQPLVMILGGGHVQHNMAVFERVAHLKPGITQLNLGLQEVAIQPEDLSAYMEATKLDNREFLPSHEYFWFTQRNSYEDPCDKFREMLKGMAETKGM